MQMRGEFEAMLSGRVVVAKRIAAAGAVLAGVMAFGAVPAMAQSYYPTRINDAKAVYVERGATGVRGDGVADDTAGLQAALDKVQNGPGQGVVFLPEGRYRISHTLFVWRGVRLIGYGAKRPVLVLGAKTPGYQEGMGYMVFFAGGRPRAQAQPGGPGGGRVPKPVPGTVPADIPMIDANPGTFYSAMSNVDFEIGEGNPAAVGIRFHAAQHCFLTHMDFKIGSGMAGLHDVGNEAEDLHFHGGQYGIMTRKPSPGWQFTLLDSTFDGQRTAAIKEHEAGLTMVGDRISHVPAAISIDPGYAEELWVKDTVFEDVSGPAVTISNETNPRTEINLENVRCLHVPVLAQMRDSGKQTRGEGESYTVKSFSHGMVMRSGSAHPDAGAEIATTVEFGKADDAAGANAGMRVIRDLPERSTWVDVRSFGAKGDGVADDTMAFKKAIAEHDTIYVPMGFYRVTDTLRLRPQTALIGLHPSMTQIDLLDGTEGFQGPGAPKALLEAPQGGHNLVVGIGLSTGGQNSRAVGALWQAGADSLMDDVRFLGGHGTIGFDGREMNPYNNTHTGDPDAKRKWDSEYPSLWVTNGGGGIFADIWTPNTFAQAGMYVSDTQTPGRVFELSSEHHVRNEVKLERAANWELDALQTEEERGEGPFCLPLDIVDSKNVTVANYHSYRVVSLFQPFDEAVHVSRSENVRLRNIHVYGDNKVSFNNSVMLGGDGQVRQREFAVMNVPDLVTESKRRDEAKVVSGTERVQKLATGFYSISGGALDAEGRLYFVDAHWQRIYRWSREHHEAEVVRDTPLEPVNLAIDKAGDVMVTSYLGKGGTVYSFRPEAPLDQITMLRPVPTEARAGATPVLPVNFFRNENDFLQAVPVKKEFQYVAPDGTTFLPAGEDFVSGALYYGTKMSDVVRAFGFQRAEPGKPFYVTDESEQKTYVGSVGADGTLGGLKLFAQRGGENVAWDAAGDVYVAAGQIYVYKADGTLREVIETPERPIQLLVGGKDGRTLYVMARSSLYEVSLR